jgi:hypothetical protein
MIQFKFFLKYKIFSYLTLSLLTYLLDMGPWAYANKLVNSIIFFSDYDRQ